MQTCSAGGEGISAVLSFDGLTASSPAPLTPFLPPPLNSNPAFASLLRIRVAVLLALAAGAVVAPHARAQTITDWTGGTSNAWATSTNWNGGVPANDLTGNITRFNQTSYNNAPTASNNYSIAGIIIGNGTTVTPTFAISTGTTTYRLRIGASGIVMNANSGNTTIGNASTQGLLVGADQSWTNNSSSLLTISSLSNVSGSNYTVTINGAGTGGTSITGAIADNTTGKIALAINTTNGTTTLAGANTFTGGLNVQRGTLALNGSTAAGARLVTIGSVGNNATLNLLGGSRTINSLATAGTAANQKITNSSATAATLNYTGASTTSTFGGVIENGSGGSTTAVTLNAAGANLTLSGNNTYSGLTTVTTGTLTLSGNNSGAGGVTLSGGQLNVTTPMPSEPRRGIWPSMVARSITPPAVR